MLKKILVMLLTVGLVMGLSSFGASEVVITHWSTGGGAVDAMELELAEKFEQLHPGVKIVFEHIPAGNMAQKVMIAIASGETPDVLKEYVGRISSYWGQGAIESLNGTLSEEDLEDFIPTVMGLCTMDGNLIGYPYPFGARSFGVNMTLLERAGVSDLVPSGDSLEWGVEAFEQAIEKVSQLEGFYGTGFFAANPSGDYHTLGVIQMFGGYLYQDGDHTKTALNSEAGVRGVQWMIDTVDKGFATPGPAGTTDDHHVEAMWSGKIAFGGWVPDPDRAQANFDSGMIEYLADYRLLEFPHEEGVAPPPVFIGPDIVCVFKGSENKEMAIEWARFQSSREVMQRWLEVFPGIPSRKSIRVDNEFTATIQSIIVKNGVGDLGFTSPFYQEVRGLLNAEVQAAFIGMKDPKQALDDFAQDLLGLWAREK